MSEMRFFDRQLACYASYHKHARNRATHFIGIPMIVFALLYLAAWVHLPGGISLALVIGVATLALWIALDAALGLAMAVVMVPLWLAGEFLAQRYSGGLWGWGLFGVLFVGGWVFQLVGHVYEGRRPALVDNLFQALIGPMFLMAEIFAAWGWRKDPAHPAPSN